MHRVLTLDEIQELTRIPSGDYYDNYDKSNWIETFDCSVCGSCENPEHCVWSVVCPRCYASISEHCTDGRGRIVVLHDERHDLALLTRTIKI